MANSPVRSVVDVGSVIADTYKIEGLIGRGGMGAVFLASHARLPGKKVAIKVLHAELHDEELLARFKREAQIASMLGHPNIVGVHDFNVTSDGMPYLVLDYLEGETLAHKIARGPIPLEQVQSIMRQVGSALAAAHREGIVHRDLKPQNIFLVPTEVDGKLVEIAKVLDFGISKWRGSQTVKTQESALLGTPQYMAPEQATGKHDSVDARTDVFALGVIVHEMLTGQPAFSGASIPEVVFKVVYEEPAPLPASVPAQIASAVKQAMAKPSEGRYATVNAFVEALTGQAMSTFRSAGIAPPELGFAAGSKRMTDQEALANTMGSGDYGGKLTPLPAAPPVDVSAPTIDSQRGNAGTLGTIAGVAAPPAPASTASTRPAATAPPGSIATSGTSPALPVAPRKRTGLIVAIAGACVAAGVAVAVIALGGGRDSTTARPTSTASAPPPPERVQIAAPDRANAPPPPQPVVTSPSPDAAPLVETGSAAVPEAGSSAPPVEPTTPATKPKSPTTKPTGPATPPPPPPDEDPGDPMAGRLREANQAFQAGDLTQALRIANEIINGGGKPRQIAGARLLRGKIHCANSDLGLLQAELRNLGSFPKLQRQLESYCNR